MNVVGHLPKTVNWTVAVDDDGFIMSGDQGWGEQKEFAKRHEKLHIPVFHARLRYSEVFMTSTSTSVWLTLEKDADDEENTFDKLKGVTAKEVYCNISNFFIMFEMMRDGHYQFRDGCVEGLFTWEKSGSHVSVAPYRPVAHGSMIPEEKLDD
jgi:hypothetical protein